MAAGAWAAKGTQVAVVERMATGHRVAEAAVKEVRAARVAPKVAGAALVVLMAVMAAAV